MLDILYLILAELPGYRLYQVVAGGEGTTIMIDFLYLVLAELPGYRLHQVTARGEGNHGECGTQDTQLFGRAQNILYCDVLRKENALKFLTSFKSTESKKETKT